MTLKKKTEKKEKTERKEDDEGAVKIAQHRHCVTCGKAVPPGMQHCSDACKAEFEKAVKRRQMLVYVMYALVAIMLVAVIFSSGG